MNPGPRWAAHPTHGVLRVGHRVRAGLGRLRCVHARALGEGLAAPPGRPDPRRAGFTRQTAAGHRPARAACWMRACPRSGQPTTRYTAAAASCAGSASPGTWRTWRSSPATSASPLPSRAVIRADEAVRDAVFERRSCGNGSKGPRFADWALIATSSPRHFLLIRRLISRPDDLTFYLCWAPEDTPATMTFFITIAGRRWPVEANVQDREGRTRLGPVPGPRLGRGSAGTPPWPPSPSCGRQPSATTCAATSPSRHAPASARPRQRRRHQRR